MKRITGAGLAAFWAATAVAETQQSISPPDPPTWGVGMEEDMTLLYGTYDDPLIAISCPEGLKQLRIAVVPAWEAGPAEAASKGSADKVTVTFGDKSFEAVQDPETPSEMSYVLTADVSTLAAIKQATNARITLAADPHQAREGSEDLRGAFDLFSTTCAYMNELR